MFGFASLVTTLSFIGLIKYNDKRKGVTLPPLPWNTEKSSPGESIHKTSWLIASLVMSTALVVALPTVDFFFNLAVFSGVASFIGRRMRVVNKTEVWKIRKNTQEAIAQNAVYRQKQEETIIEANKLKAEELIRLEEEREALILKQRNKEEATLLAKKRREEEVKLQEALQLKRAEEMKSFSTSPTGLFLRNAESSLFTPTTQPLTKTEISKNFYNSRSWQDIRHKALALSDGCCCLCGRSKRDDGIKLHVDHIKPRSKFPHLALSLSNLQVLCEDCNMGKSNRSCRDWRSSTHAA